MKIEKLTENKIRIIINLDDLDEENVDLHSLMKKALESPYLISDILIKAEKELGFKTDGCKLLIEAFSSLDDIYIFTITKYEPSEINQPKKKLVARRKTANIKPLNSIYYFNNFDEFCNFCIRINSINNFDVKKLCKDISLYLFKNTYYLVFKNINIDYELIKLFFSEIAEFGKNINFSENFERKLLEHGKILNIFQNKLNIYNTKNFILIRKANMLNFYSKTFRETISIFLNRNLAH